MSDLTRITVNISDMKVSDDRGAYLITHSLGSCIGIIAHDPTAAVGGLLHFQLPDSTNHGKRAQENPFMFADTGIPLFLERVAGLGASKGRIRVSMFGGANMLDDEELFKIGTKNARAAKKVLWQHSIAPVQEDVGGKSSRTISLEIATGEIGLRRDGKVYRL